MPYNTPHQKGWFWRIFYASMLFLWGLTPLIYAAETGYVQDNAAILSEYQKLDLVKILSELDQKTGAQIVIVTTSKVDTTPIQDVANDLFDKLKPGNSIKNNGIIFIVRTSDQRIFIATGHGLESIFPDGKIGFILDSIITPRFREGRLDQGIMDGTLVLARLIAQHDGVKLTGSYSNLKKSKFSANFIGIWVAIILVAMLFFKPTRVGLLYAIALMGIYNPRYRDNTNYFDGFNGSGFSGFGGGISGGGGAGRSW